MSEKKEQLQKSKLVKTSESDTFVELQQLELQITQEEKEINEILNITNIPGQLTFDIEIQVKQIDEDVNDNFYTRPSAEDIASKPYSDANSESILSPRAESESRKSSSVCTKTILFNKYAETKLSDEFTPNQPTEDPEAILLSDEDLEPRLVIDDKPPTIQLTLNDIQNISEVNSTSLQMDSSCVLCDLCGINMKESELQKHIDSLHPNSGLQILKETNYNKTITILYSTETVYNETVDKLQCSDCKLVLHSRHLWRIHFLMQYHTCSNCGKYYYRCVDLQRHAVTCKGVKLKETDFQGELTCYKCTICDCMFSEKKDLEVHLSEVHVPSSTYLMPVRLTKCQTCKMNYAGFCLAHYCTKKKNKYFCKYCSKGFKNRLFFMAHCLAYLKDGKVICNKNRLTSIYQCLLCQSEFCMEENVEEHLIQIHKMENYILARAYYKHKMTLMNATIKLNEDNESKNAEGNDTNVKSEDKISKSTLENELELSVKYIENLLTKDKYNEDATGPAVVKKDHQMEVKQNSDPPAYNVNLTSNDKFAIDADIASYAEDASNAYVASVADVTLNLDVTSKDDGEVEIIEDACVTIDVDEEQENIHEMSAIQRFQSVTNINNVKIKVERDSDIYEVSPIEHSFSSEEVKVESISEDFEDDIIILNTVGNYTDHNLYNVKEDKSNKINNSKTERKNGKKIYKCNYCSFEDIYKYYAMHQCPLRKSKIEENLNKIKKIYSCTYCNFVGHHRDYKKHNLFHNNKREKKKPDLFQRKDLNCSKCKNRLLICDDYRMWLRCVHCNIFNCRYCSFKSECDKTYRNHLECHFKDNYIKVMSFNKSTFNRHYSFQCKLCKNELEAKKLLHHWSVHVEEFFANVALKPSITVKQETQIAQQSYGMLLSKEVLQEVIRGLMYNKGYCPCNVCNKTFNRSTDYKRHLIEHLLLDAYSKRDKTNSLDCQICSLALERESDYKQHMREHGSLTTYKCPLCHKCFSDSSNFSKHKKVHNMTALICDLCNRKFFSKNQIIKHFEKHKDTQPIRCALCEKDFWFLSQFWKHMKMAHVKTILKYRCPICRLRFPSLKRKWDHQWAEHKIRAVAADCQLCGQKYRKISDLKNHISICMFRGTVIKNEF